MTVPNTRDELLADLYESMDAKDWASATRHLTADCRWHILGNDTTPSRFVVGPNAISTWMSQSLGDINTVQAIRKMIHDGDVSIVLLDSAVTDDNGSYEATQVDVFTFRRELIAEHVSLTAP